MAFSRAGFRRRNKKEENENPGLRFLYSEAVAKVLWKYSSCVNVVCKKYPASYVYKDNSDLTIHNLPHLTDHYDDIPLVSSAKVKPSTARAGHSLSDTDVKRSGSFLLPRIDDSRSGMTSRDIGVRNATRNYHSRCHERFVGRNDSTFLTERRSAYHSRRIPSALGTPPPSTLSNRPILEKLWIERIPLCRD